MSQGILERQLDALDGRAIDTARRLGRSAVATLSGRVRSPRKLERGLVIECLGEVHVPEATATVVEALEDRALHVRSIALRVLGRAQPPAASARLLALLCESRYAEVRGGAALLLGRTGGANARQPITEQRQREVDAGIARDMDLALARLGDPDAKRKIMLALSALDARSRYGAIADLEYVNDPDTADNMARLLEDEAAVVNIGGHYPVWHRVCDRAVEATVALLKSRVPFAVGLRPYSPEERTQVLTLIKRRTRPA